MAKRAKVVLRVTIDLDSLPGENYTGENCAQWVQMLLSRMIPHYNPAVEILRNDRTEKGMRFTRVG